MGRVGKRVLEDVGQDRNCALVKMPVGWVLSPVFRRRYFLQCMKRLHPSNHYIMRTFASGESAFNHQEWRFETCAHCFHKPVASPSTVYGRFIFKGNKHRFGQRPLLPHPVSLFYQWWLFLSAHSSDARLWGSILAVVIGYHPVLDTGYVGAIGAGKVGS